MDGNTAEGQRPVTVTFTEDEARQVLRSVEWERMMNGHIADGSKVPEENIQKVAKRRAFIEQIINKLYDEIKKQLV